MPSSTTNKRASIGSISTISSSTSSISSDSSSTTHPALSRQSSISGASRHSQPQVQLIPHAPTPTYHDAPLTTTERALVRASESKISEFDDLDLSSADFDFDDVFTFDKPARKFRQGCVEVSIRGAGPPSSKHRSHHHHRTHQEPPKQFDATTAAGRRDWSDFSFSHYGAAQGNNVRHHHHHHPRQKQGMAGMQRELLGLDFARMGIGAKYLRNQQLLMQQGRR